MKRCRSIQEERRGEEREGGQERYRIHTDRNRSQQKGHQTREGEDREGNACLARCYKRSRTPYRRDMRRMRAGVGMGWAAVQWWHNHSDATVPCPPNTGENGICPEKRSR